MDADDLLHGGDGQSDLGGDFDVLTGDNARITRPLSFGQWQINAFNGSVRRTVILFDEQLLGGPSIGDQTSGSDQLHGEGSDDLLYGQGGDDALFGGAGDDYLEGNSAHDALRGDAGQDDLIGGSAAPGRLDGSDTLFGGDSASILTSDFDVLTGDNAAIARPLSCGRWQVNAFNLSIVRNVTLFEVSTVGGSVTLGRDDRLHGEGGDDLLYGQGGDDALFGGAGDDYLEGNADRDTLAGGDGNDDLVGGTGRINADGPSGTPGRLDDDDMISGGAGFDVIAGDNAILTRVQTGKPSPIPCQTWSGSVAAEQLQRGHPARPAHPARC